MSSLDRIDRRTFLKLGAATGGGLLLGVSWIAWAEDDDPDGRPLLRSEPVRLNAFVEIDTAGNVVITAPVPEIGQGVRTSLPMIVADELAADWSRVRVRQAPTGPDYGGMSAAGSDSIADYWEPLRRVGASARMMLAAAAASRWGVEADECQAVQGEIRHPATGRRFSYGELAADAATLPVPDDPKLKTVDQFTLIGKHTRGVDAESIAAGSAIYGLDAQLPDMRYAAVARCPVQGGRVAHFDPTAALQVEGVVDVVEIKPHVFRDLRYGAVRGGVAVIATHTWAAIQGRKALTVSWEEGPARAASSEKLRAEFERRKGLAGARTLRNEGNTAQIWRDAAVKVEAEYELPLLAHGCMEPVNFTAHATSGSCEAIGPTQNPLFMRDLIAEALGLEAEQVRVQPTLAGGGFGRRLAVDYGVEAALVSREAGVPVQVVWTRKDDVQQDYYRPPSHHVLQAGLDARGRIQSWRHHILSAGLRRHIQGPHIDTSELYDVQGAADIPYAIANKRIEFTDVDVELQLGSWRSVSHSFNVFAVASFLDEIAAARGVDPLDLQRELLTPAQMVEVVLPLPGSRGRVRADTGRLLHVLEVAAAAAGWGDPLPPGRGRGLACSVYKESYAAHVAEVSVEGGRPRVHRVTAALDCGTVVNPDGLTAQVEGAAMDGVATVLHWGISYSDGRVQQSNFHDFQLLRLNEAPEVEVHLIPSDAPPRGAGEPPYPSVAPAITNAIFAATGTRVRRLPIRRI